MTYEMTCAAMLRALELYLDENPTARPVFGLPPTEIGLIACLDQVPGVARNEAARELVYVFCEIGLAIQPNGQPTMLMLAAVLDRAGIPIERVSLADLGIIAADKRARSC